MNTSHAQSYRHMCQELDRVISLALDELREIEACFGVCTRYCQAICCHPEDTRQSGQLQAESGQHCVPFWVMQEYYKKRYHAAIFRPDHTEDQVLFWQHELTKIRRQFDLQTEALSADDQDMAMRENPFEWLAFVLALDKYRQHVQMELIRLKAGSRG